MTWSATQEVMRQRLHRSAQALGILGILAGAVLLRRPVPRWIGWSTLADGVLRFVSGKGVIDHAYGAAAGQEEPPETLRATEPATSEV